MNVRLTSISSSRDRSKNMESPSINMKFQGRNFSVDERELSITPGYRTDKIF